MSVIDAIIARKLCGGGGGSVPKPLTYDYMPEGYPTKATGTVTLMEEQELAFDLNGGLYGAALTEVLELIEGQTYTVNWDGTEYECVCVFIEPNYALGNLSIFGVGDDTGEPFICTTETFVTLDTAASHTISVTTIAETVTPMTEEFLPSRVTAAIENAQTAAANAQTTANNAENIASAALPLSGGVIRISGGSQVATLTLDEFTGSSGAQKRGIRIGGSGAYGQPILEVTHNDITIYDDLAQRRIGGLNSRELFLRSKDSAKIFKITVDDSGTLAATEVT